MASKIQLRRGTAAEWTSANPTLSQGEFGYETDTGKFKIGNNSNNWATLPYVAVQGVQGITGNQGIQGIQGSQGIQGIQGITGEQGIQGVQGIQSLQGIQGIQGASGTGGGSSIDLGAITESIIPDTDITYDLGSPTNRFRDLYLSTSTLYLGETALGISPDGELEFKTFGGGGEGSGAGSSGWGGTNYDYAHVEISHPLFNQIMKLRPGDKLKNRATDFFTPTVYVTLTVTGLPVITQVQDSSFDTVPDINDPDAFFAFISIPVDTDSTTVSGNIGYYMEFIRGISRPPGIPGPYADDTAAAAAGLAVGSMYYKTGGAVYVRLT